MIQQVQLANTFNQFRETTNLIIDEVNKLSDGTGTLVIDTIEANSVTGLLSANGAAFFSLNASNLEFGTISNSRTTGSSSNGASTLVLRNLVGDFSANVITSTSTGGSPFVVASNVVVANLNSDQVDGKDIGTLSAAGGIVYASSTTALAGTVAGTSGQAVISGGSGAPTFQTVASSNGASTIVARDANGDFSSRRITSTIATGTSPFVVSSTTAVTNLNSDKVDGKDIGTLSAAGGIVYASSTTALAGTVAGASGQAVISGGSDAPTFQTVASSNGASTIVARDADGSFAANVITVNHISGNGQFLSSTNASNITVGTINNDRTTGDSSNGANKLVLRDADGNFSANTVYVLKINGSGAELSDLNASNIATGTINNDRTTGSSANDANKLVLRDADGSFAANVVTLNILVASNVGGDGSQLLALNASNIATGTINNDRTTGDSSNGANKLVLRNADGSFAANVITVNHISGNGQFLSSTNASNITVGTINNDRTTGDSSNGANKLVLRDADGSFAANVITVNHISGNGQFLSSTNASNITVGTINNNRTTGSSANDANKLVLRDADGSFAANVITVNHISGNGQFLSSTNASNITVGTINNDRTTGDSSNGANKLVLRDADGDFSSRRITSTIATGTSPFVVSSTTVVSNLNADLLDGIQGASLLRSDASDSYTSGTLTFNNGTTLSAANGSVVNFNNIVGTSPFFVTSTTAVANLNSDKVDGKDIGTLSAAGGIVYASSTTALAGTVAGTAGQAVISGGSGAPTFQTVSSSNDASTIVARDANGSFSANVVTANSFSSSNTGTGEFSTSRSANSFVSTTSQTAIDSFKTNEYRSAKYFVQMFTATGSNKYHVLELTVMHDDANVYISQYGEIVSNTALATFDSSISTQTLTLFATPTYANTEIKFFVNQMRI